LSIKLFGFFNLQKNEKNVPNFRQRKKIIYNESIKNIECKIRNPRLPGKQTFQTENHTNPERRIQQKISTL